MERICDGVLDVVHGRLVDITVDVSLLIEVVTSAAHAILLRLLRVADMLILAADRKDLEGPLLDTKM